MGVLNEQLFAEVQVQSAYYNSMQVNTKLIKYQAYQIPSLSNTKLIIYQAYQIPSLSNTMVQVQTVIQMCTIVVHTRVVHHVHDLLNK